MRLIDGLLTAVHPHMRLYNTLTRREEDFAPSRDNQVRMYSCGLTVYARGHIGNFRTFVAVDVLRRALKYQEGFDVQHVMNFTDVDDRTILESNKAGVPLREYTDRYIAAFREDAAALGLETARGAAARHRRREHHGDGARRSARSSSDGHTYRSDGSIYFKISTFPEYGKLARLDHSGIKSGARVDSDKYDKDDARDFVLWKATQAGRADVGRRHSAPGRPGWHIECSAMALRLLGEPPIDHPRRRRRPDLSASRERDRAERRRDRPAVLALLDARRAPDDRGGRAAARDKMSKSLGNVFNLATSSSRASGRRRCATCISACTTGSS